jgi:hypothetical protein
MPAIDRVRIVRPRRRVPPVSRAGSRRAGKRSLPDGVGAQLYLLDERRFSSGVIHLRYRI